MVQKWIRNWWLLALCGVLDAVYSFIYLFTVSDGSLHLRRALPMATVVDLCVLAALAGICTLAAALWTTGKVRSWLLAVNGLALGTFGLMPLLWDNSPHSFRGVAPLLIAMAFSAGVLAIMTAFPRGRRIAQGWWLGTAGAASVGFGLLFFAIGFLSVRFQRPDTFLFVMSAYFGISAICMLGLAARWRPASPATFAR